MGLGERDGYGVRLMTVGGTEWGALPLPLPRLRGALALLFATALLSGGAAVAGAGLIVRAADLRRQIPNEARYSVVARSTEIGVTREQIERLPGVVLAGERRARDILARAGAADPAPDLLRVLELAVPLHGEGAGTSEATLRGLPGVVDVIDLNVRERRERTAGRVARQLLPGVVLVVVGCGVFFAAISATTSLAGRELREEIGVRVLLGVDPERLWARLGLLVAGIALAGVAASFALAIAAAALLGTPAESAGGFPTAAFACGAVALLAGTLALGLASARRAVARAVRAIVLASLVGLVSLASPESAPAGPSPPFGDLEQHADRLRALSREVAVCRRARHLAGKAWLLSEEQALRALAAKDRLAARVALAQVSEDLAGVRRWDQRCARLRSERTALRDALRESRALGPPSEPWHAPVDGPVAIGFGQAGRRHGTAGFRNGVALRTSAGEEVHATARGRVAYAGALAGSEPVVVIDHGRRTYSVYARIDEPTVARGTEVEAGATIARARAVLLYFSIRRRGRPIDPMTWVTRAG